MKATRMIEHYKEKIQTAEDDIRLLQEDIHAYQLKLLTAVSRVIEEENAFSEAPWKMISNHNDKCNFNLYGGQNPDRGCTGDTPRPKLFKIMNELLYGITNEEEYSNDFFYQDENEGWSVSATNGRVAIYFENPNEAYEFIGKYGLAVDIENIQKRIEELTVLVEAQERMYSPKEPHDTSFITRHVRNDDH